MERLPQEPNQSLPEASVPGTEGYPDGLEAAPVVGADSARASPDGHTDRRHSTTITDASRAAGFGGGYLLLQFMMARASLPHAFAGSSAALMYVASLVSLVITLAYTVSLARSLRSLISQALWLVVTAGVMLPFIALPFLRVRTPAQRDIVLAAYHAYQNAFHALPGLRGILLISLAVSFGVVLSRLVREIKILLPVAVVLALVDLYVVFGGGLVTQANSGKAPAAQIAMNALSVALTPRLPANVHAPPPLAVGFADFLFIALFFACFRRFGVPARRTFALLCGILCLYMLAVILGSLDLPALVPIAVVVIGSHLSAFRYQRDEAFALLYAGLIVVGILATLVYASHR